MATLKNYPMLLKIPDDEPVFCLRAQDVLAAPMVRRWAQRAISLGNVPATKIEGAIRAAEEMERWAAKEGNVVKSPD